MDVIAGISLRGAMGSVFSLSLLSYMLSALSDSRIHRICRMSKCSFAMQTCVQDRKRSLKHAVSFVDYSCVHVERFSYHCVLT